MRANPETSLAGNANVAYKTFGEGTVFQLGARLAQPCCNMDRWVRFYDLLVKLE